MARKVCEVAAEIKKEWGAKVNYAAKPYLAALLELESASDNYINDSGKSVAIYFLGNARSFKGEKAKALKAELKSLYGIK